MKKNFKLHSGFSVAELMITMLITMLIAAALVPIIGPRKIKNADPRHLHGIAECYWTDDGANLMYYYADNKEHKKAGDQITKTVTDPGYCTFDVPKGTYFDIYAVGAGSRGTGLAEDMVGDLTTRLESDPKFPLQPIRLTAVDDDHEQVYQHDLSDNIVAFLGAHDNTHLIPGQNIAELVQGSVTRWAKRINHMGEISDHDVNPQEDDGSEIPGVDLDTYNPDGEYLYAEFIGLRGPIGSGGAGLSEIPAPAWYDQPPLGSGIVCSTVCSGHFGSGICPESALSLTRVHHNDPDITIGGTSYHVREALQLSVMPNYEQVPPDTCKYFHVHAKGGDSAPAVGVDANTSVLFPIDGDSRPELREGKPYYYKKDGTNYNKHVSPSGHSLLQISIGSIYHGDPSNIILSSSQAGKNAYYNSSDEMVDGPNGSNGSHLVYARCSSSNDDLTSDTTNAMPVIKLLSGTVPTNFSCDNMSRPEDNASFIQIGMQYGRYGSASGLLFKGEHTDAEYYYSGEPYSDLGSKGNLGNITNIFSWTINEPHAYIKYTRGGNAGELRTLTFAHLRGPLYLKPGQNIEGTRTHTYVYTDKNNMAGSTILMAESPPDNTDGEALQDGDYLLGALSDPSSPLPPPSILNEAYPDNQKFYEYIDAIRSVRQWGLNGGLITDCATYSGDALDKCIDDKYWPGYGGSGAFPMLNNQNFNYTLTLVNNQAYANSYTDNDVRRRYIRTFPRTLEYEPECPDGYWDPTTELEPNEGEEIQHYCTAKTEMRRDGAVIIVW